MADEPGHVVAVVGAGPAGLFATRALAAAGCRGKTSVARRPVGEL